MPIQKAGRKPTGVPGVFKLGPRRFLAVVQWTDQKGRRRKKERIEASLAAAIAFREWGKGTDTIPRHTRPRFADFAEHWIEVNVGSFEESSQSYYINNIAHLTAAFGNYYVDALRVKDLRERFKELDQEKEYGRTTLNGWLRVMRQVLDDAVEDGILAANPARSVKALREGRTKGPRGTSLKLEMFRRFLPAVEVLMATRDAEKKISEDVGRMLLTDAWSGMRLGELLALKWMDIVDGEIYVQRSVWRQHEKATKTDDPRLVTVVEPLKKVLAAQRNWLLSTQHPGLSSGLVFPASPRHARAGATRRGVDEVSWYRSPNVMNGPLKKVVEEAGLPPISVHSFRRTWENNLRAAGVDQLVRRALAGWRTEEAQAIYAEVDRKEREAAAQAVVKLVMGE